MLTAAERSFTKVDRRSSILLTLSTLKPNQMNSLPTQLTNLVQEFATANGLTSAGTLILSSAPTALVMEARLAFSSILGRLVVATRTSTGVVKFSFLESDLPK
jgi:hypothetical protein